MIGAICPNFSDKKVKAQFEELKELFGEDKAYLVWHRNNGNPIDKAPNGAESILFLNLLEELKGDRSSAIIAKTKIYTSQFLDNFGNWIDLLSADDIADKVDSNGEPLLQFVDYKSVKGTDSPLTSQVVQHLSDTLKQIGLEVRSKDDMRSFLSAEDRLVLAYDEEDLPFFKTSSGEVYGFVDKDGNIYLDETVISPEHPIHEYTHLWDRVVAKRNPKLWKRGIQLMRKTSLWKEIEESENYGKKWKAVKGMTQDRLDNLIASEVHARFVGEGGSQLLEKLSKEKGSKNIILKIKDWLLEFWKDLKSTFSAWSQEELYDLTLKDFNHMTMRDFIEGVNLRDEGIELTDELRQIRLQAISNGTYMKAPNGKPTNLTEKQWLQVRTNAFKEWFGDWINDPANASKVVDENGEPLVVYHGTFDEFTEFDFGKLGLTTGLGEYTDKTTGEKTQSDSSKAFFFTDKYVGAASYKYLSINFKNQFRAAIYKNLIGAFRNTKWLMSSWKFDEELKLEQRDFIDNVISPYMGFDVRKEANAVLDGTSKLSEEQRILIADVFKKALHKINRLPDVRSITNQHLNILHSIDELELLLKNRDNILQNKHIEYFDEHILFVATGYGDWNKGDIYVIVRKDKDLNKYVVTGIPQKNGKIEEGSQVITEDNFDSIIKFWELGIKKNILDFKNDKKEGKYDTRGHIMEVFLNIKNPLEHDYEGSPFPDDYKKNKKYPTAYIAARLVKRALKDGNDGVIYKNVVDPIDMNSYGIFSANLVKSATDNNGMFSAENNDILMFVDSTPRVSDAEAALNESLTKKMYLTAVDIQEKREEYITNAVQIYKDSVESPKAELISRIKHQSRIDFDNNELNKLLKLQQRLLAVSYNLRFNSKGFYESSNEDDKNIMAEHFINSLQENTAKNYLIEVSGKPKYDRVGVPQNAASVSNVIYNAIFNGDLTTLDKALARDYVRMFWTTNLILSALDSLNDDSRSLTSLQLEDKLVDHMTRIPVEDRQNSIIDWLINIWNDLNELVKQIFSGVRFTNDQRQDILKAVDAAFMITLDLRTAESFSPVYDRQDGNFDTSKFLTVRDKNALKNLHSGLKARLRGRLSRRIRDQRLINNLKLEIAGLEGHENFTVDQIFEKIQQFLFSSNNEIGNIKIMLDEEFNSDNMDNWSIEKINFVQQDVIGFYKNSLQDFLDLFSDKTSALAKLNEIASESGDELNLHNYCKQLMAELNAVESMYKSDIVMPYCRYALSKYIDTQENITDKEAYLYNLIKWMEQDASYGDVSTGELWLGMYSRSKSELVKAMDHMITEAELKTHRQVLKIGNEIMNAYERIRPKGSQMSPQNYQRFLCELDRNGVPTGYFIREINEGQFFIDKKEYEAKLREEFNLQADADGYTIFPEENYKDDNSIYNQYYDKLDAWLDKHCNRRYKLEYYLTRRRILSPQTIAELNRIQYQIDLIIDNAKREFTPGGKKYIDKSKLTMDERQQLDVLLREKRNLGEHYIFTENEDGIVTLIPKTDKALEMADEITKWNEFIAKKITYKPDWDSFRQAVAKVASESGGMDSDAVNEFKRNNTIQTLTPEFYDLLQRASSSVMYTDPEIPKLQRRYREILRYVKAKTGSGQANLFKFGLGIGTDTSAWLELSRLELEISDRKRDSAVSVGNSSEDGLTFDEFAAILPVTVSDDDDTSFISYLINQWNKVYHGASTDGRFNELFTYINPKGRRQHLKAFDYLSALDYSIEVDGKIIKLLEPNMPISEYSVLDDASEYVNENFDSAGNAMLPKARNERGEILYEDLRFKLLTAELLQFRNMLLDYMDRFNAMIPNRSTTRDYLRPLISGSYATVFMNTMRGKELGLAFKYAFRKTGLTSLTNELAETDEDVSTNEDIPRRPDGTPINNIPIRFIRKLPNPAMLTGDVVGSVIMFADMAYNYYNKASLIDTLELLKYAATPNQGSANSMKNQFAKIDDLLNYRYFGKETTFGFNNDAKITPAKQRTLQGVKFFKRLTQTALLGWNFTTVEVGFLDALLSMFADAIGAKYITFDDFKYAFWECFAHTYGAVHGFGKAVVDDKLVAAMQYNGLSKNNRAIFRHTEKSSVKRLIGDTMSMGGYTLSDYMINGAMLAATYHTFRLIQTPDGSAKFYSRHQAINKLTKLGMTESEADYMWSKSKITLWDAYEVKDGYFTLRDEYRGIVNEYLENIVAGRLRDRTAIYNGVVPEEEKARIYKNMVGSFLTMMRGFYINTYWERYGNDNHGYAKPGEDRKTSWRNLHKQDEGTTYNFLTGENSSMVFKSFVRGTYILCSNLKNKLAGNDGQKLTLEQNYAVRRLWTELAIIGVNLFLMMFSTLFARSNDYEPEDDDDKIPVWMYNVEGFNPFSDKKLIDFHLRNCDKKFLDFLRWKTALLSTKLFTERMTSWYPPTVLEIIQSPSVANSYIKDLEEILNISDLFATLFTQAGDEQIKRDGYKGSSRRTKVISTITKPTGVNAFMKEWHTAGIKAKFNTYRKMHPADIFVPTQSEWEESLKEANSDEIGTALSGGSEQVLMQ